jgi:hypothetical protein
MADVHYRRSKDLYPNLLRQRGGVIGTLVPFTVVDPSEAVATDPLALAMQSEPAAGFVAR